MESFEPKIQVTSPSRQLGDATPVRLWDHLDYRRFLKAFYESRKRHRGGFSYRLFSRATGVRSPNYLKLIIDGDRNLTPTHARRVAKYLKLSSEETVYFLALVRWNQCRDPQERETLWEEVLRARRHAPCEKFPYAHLSILTRWKTVALLELLRLPKCRPDAAWIQAQLRMPITAQEIEEGLAALEAAGLLERRGKALRLLHNSLKTEDDLPSPCIRSFHRGVIQEGIDALEHTALDEREFISSTVAVRREDLPKLKTELRKVRDCVLELSSRGENLDSVYQINFQLFPLTKSKGERS